MSTTSAFERFPYPRELVVGLLSEEENLQQALATLKEAGFGSDRCDVLHGEQDADSLDVTGDAHGLRGHLIRALQTVSSYDLEHARRHAEHLRAGHYVLAVSIGADEDAKQQAAEALRAAGPHRRPRPTAGARSRSPPGCCRSRRRGG
jgi:hypothetical protein